MQELSLDEDKFHLFFRMTREQFSEMLYFVETVRWGFPDPDVTIITLPPPPILGVRDKNNHAPIATIGA